MSRRPQSRIPGRSRATLAILIGLSLCGTVWAHDPLEVTATLYFRTNQVELIAEMEFRPARVLAKAPGNASYEEVLAELNARAGTFFNLKAGTESVAPSSAAALEAVENHVQLRLLYERPAGTSFQVEAPLLTELAADGPYGVLLTTLDMVNQKVVNQSVLFEDGAASPPLSVLPAVATKAAPASSPAAQPETAAAPEALAAPAPVNSVDGNQTNYRLVWWCLAGIIAGSTIWWSIRRKGTHDK